jgi:hypothetical protein
MPSSLSLSLSPLLLLSVAAKVAIYRGKEITPLLLSIVIAFGYNYLYLINELRHYKSQVPFPLSYHHFLPGKPVPFPLAWLQF